MNPIVLIYRILVISFLNKKQYKIYLFKFIYHNSVIGKIVKIYDYIKFSHLLKAIIKNVTTCINRDMGILVFLGILLLAATIGNYVRKEISKEIATLFLYSADGSIVMD